MTRPHPAANRCLLGYGGVLQRRSRQDQVIRLAAEAIARSLTDGGWRTPSAKVDLREELGEVDLPSA